MIDRFTTKNSDGTYSHTFLSNFHPSPFEFRGIHYPTNEHFYQAQKTTDPDKQARIASAPTPGAAKKLGRSVTIRDDWDAVKLAVMRRGLELKFAKDSPLAIELIGTGRELLEERNEWGDRFWGVTEDGKGFNWLGFFLMARRAELRGF